MAKKDKDEALGMGAWVFALLSVVFAFVRGRRCGTGVQPERRRQDASRKRRARPSRCLEFKIDPSMIAVDTGGSLTAKNAGTVAHNLAIKGTGLKTADIAPGKSASRLDVSSLKTGMYTAYCQISGHEAAGHDGDAARRHRRRARAPRLGLRRPTNDQLRTRR